MVYDRIKTTQNRLKSYWFRDGLWDMGFGMALLILGLFNACLDGLLISDNFSLLLGILEILIVVLPFLLLGRVVNYLKERITYPRTGYVEYRHLSLSQRNLRMLRAALIGFIFAIMFAFINLVPSMSERLPAFSGLVLGLVTGYMGARFHVNRYYLMGFLTLVLGVGISFISAPINRSIGLFFIAFGLLWLIGGMITLWNYLRQTHRTNEETDEGHAREQ